MPEIPSGTVTFIFTDIEGSTGMWENSPEVMQVNFTRQEALLRETFTTHGGYVYKMIGDAFQVAFATAPVALAAAVEAQRRLNAEAWVGSPIRVRMALHTGVTEERVDDYVGPVLNRVARLMAAGHGGQILLSQVTYELVRDDLPAGVCLMDAGMHRLKDLIRPEHIYQVDAPGLMTGFPPLKTLDSYPHNLPIQLTSFVGREKEMAEVRQLIGARPGSARLVTLTGPGGTGKTRLSLHVAADLLEHFPNGVWFVELATLADPALVTQTIAEVLGIHETPGRSIHAALINQLRQKRLLLILDNCEHMVEACARAADALLRGCPALCILASSRELLGVEGETPYRVPALSTPDTRRLPPLETLPQFDAVRLFIERAATASPGFTVTNSNAPAIAEICHRLDGIPLAIELVAARAAMLSVDQIAVRLDNSFRLLTGGSRTAMPHHQTLRALIDWSYDMLPPAEQILLQRLSVFQGGWNLEAAEAVCSDPEEEASDAPLIDRLDILDLIAQLVKKSLVQVERSNGETRYRLLETIRQYAREKLANEKLANERLAVGREASLRNRHMVYFLGRANQPEEVLRGPKQAAWIEYFEFDLDNIRTALDWSLQSDIAAGLHAASALLWFWHIRSYGSEGLERLERLLAADEQQCTAPEARPGQAHIAPERAVARARALNAAGFLHCAYDETGQVGTALLEESLILLQELDGSNTIVQCEIANARLNLGRLAATARDYAKARLLFEQALAGYRAAGARFGQAESLNELGMLEMIAGRQRAAAQLLMQSLALRRSIGDQDGMGFILASLSEFAFLQGNLPRARQLIEESLETFKRARNRIFTNMGLDFLSLVIWLMGDEEGAIRVYEAFHADSSPAHQNRTGEMLIRRANIELSHGRDEAAGQLFDQALSFGQLSGGDGFTCMALLGLGRIAWGQGKRALASQRLREALRAGQLYDFKGLMAHIYCCLGLVALSQGDPDEALASIKQALPLFQMPFYHWAVVIGLDALISLAVFKGQYEQAARLSGAAEHMTTLTARFHTPAERTQLETSIRKARVALGEAEFERIKADGQKLSLEQAAAIMD